MLYPWGYTGKTTSESYTSLRGLADKYVALADRVHGFDYVAGQSNYTIYATNGDFMDYSYGTHGILAYTPELRPESSNKGGFVLPEEQIRPNNEENMLAALWLMDNVANARLVAGPESGMFAEGMNPFSIPLTPLTQKPEGGVGMDSATAEQVQAWLDDQNHIPAFYGSYPEDFESISPGSAYQVEYSPEVAAWSAGFAGYTALPHVFEDGAVIMLSNYDPGINLIGIPFEAPVKMSDLSVFRRVVKFTGNSFGYKEVVVAERSPLYDMTHPSPWLSWTWTYTAPDGSEHVSHPLGEGGADEYLHPYLAYELFNNKESYRFGSTDIMTGSTYALRFPPPLRADADGDGDLDGSDYAAFHACMTGPVQQSLSEQCGVFDLEHDFDVDNSDLAVLERLYTGEQGP